MTTLESSRNFGSGNRGRTRYSDDELFENLRELARRRGGRLTMAEYRDDPDALMTQRGLFLRFGTWNDVLRRAGLPLNGPDHAHCYDRWRWSREECIRVVADVARVLGELPSYGDYEAYRACEGSERFPCGSTVRHRGGGSWVAVLEQVAELLAEPAA